MAETRAIPRPFVVLAVAMFSLACVLFALSFRRLGLDLGINLLLIAIVAVVSENTAPTIGRYGVSLAQPLTMAAMLLQGPTAAAFVGGLPALTANTLRTRRGFFTTLANMGQFVIVSLAAGWVYLAMGGRTLVSSGVASPLAPADFPAILVPMAAAAIIAALGNLLFVSIGVAVLYSLRIRDALLSAAGYVPSLIALAAVGYMIAQVMASSAASLILFVFPLAVAQSLYKRFKSLKEAYADTVRSFVGALEAKDTYTHGHSERVAEYAISIGKEMGLDERSLERLEYSALLHDLGKLALPGQILTKAESLTDEEMSAMRGHPAAGATMVERIPPLRGLAPMVLRHHEYYGGGGYPSGVSGESIPLQARILSVADAYDAMTTDRAYRRALTHDESVAELHRGSGTQFDPSVVDAFVQARSAPRAGESATKSEPLMAPDAAVAGN